MEIHLENIGKRFNRDWIFRDLNHIIPSEGRLAILGGNGSGKSTLLQIISGYLSPSSGQIHWNKNETSIPSESVFGHISLCSPLLELYDDFTLEENFDFASRFRSYRLNDGAHEFAHIIGLEKHLTKQLRHYSSGMRQRVKLGLAILAESEILLLDEPTSHLDSHAIHWFQRLLSDNMQGRTLVVASNSHKDEIALCTSQVIVENYRQ